MRYWNIARQRHYRFLSAMLLDLRVSADRAVWHPPHTGGKPGLFQEPRRNPERDGLSAGAGWIRTFSSAVDWQQFVVSSELGRSTGARSSEQLPASANRSSYRTGSGAISTRRKPWCGPCAMPAITRSTISSRRLGTAALNPKPILGSGRIMNELPPMTSPETASLQ